ncbi:MAG: hypothetical protein LC679_03790 [Intrasporangiaceae bacterium]|nr:hypothetical protein [Intrasporangiaceae bacterium]
METQVVVVGGARQTPGAAMLAGLAALRGDVLVGAVSGLLSRGAPRDQALVWGAYAHAAAGDVLATKFGRVGSSANCSPSCRSSSAHCGATEGS